MSRKLTRNVMLAVAAAAIAAGAIVAAVTSGGGHHGARSASAHAAGRSGRPSATGELALAADYLGMTRTQLQKELQSGRTLAQIAKATSGKSAAGLVDALVRARAARLSAAVGAQKLSRATEQRRLASLRRRIEARVKRSDRSGTRSYAELAAAYLGVRAQALRGELAAGRSLAQIAAATPGRSAAGLIDALARARIAALKAALASGEITQATETTLRASVRRLVTAQVERTQSPTG
jgi:hypothetical protein